MPPPQNFNYPAAQMIPTDVVENLPERGTLCRCTAKGWTLFIGWSEIMEISLKIVLSYPFKKNLLFTCNDAESSFKETIMCGAIQLSISLSLVVMAIVLIAGAKYENVGCLQAWIMYKSIYLVLYVVFSISQAELSQDGEELTYNVTKFIMHTMIKSCLR
ncbi:unnamed protein product [Allacma fusca]|uniref:Uncharacterized protein n=1 Tax=Allacma fusca TaxID=39272 RepID=A0A8J2LDJ7_9HEXA|nr:unnamed protein product [Allacma fusca]